jgi:hypothetical protein
MTRRDDDVFVASDSSLKKLNQAIGGNIIRSTEVAKADLRKTSSIYGKDRAFLRIRINGTDYDAGGTDDGLCQAFLRAICDAAAGPE